MLVVLNAPCNGTAAVDVTLHERVAPEASVVRLADVADVTAADRQAARQLESLPLMPAPAPGTERVLRTREIADMLAAQGVELGDIRFGGADRVAIDGGGRNAVPTSKASRRIGAPLNRHAAILAGATEVVAPPIDETRAKELRQRLTNIIANYVGAKTGKVEAWRIECDVTNRELRQLDRAMSAPVCSGGREPWVGRQRFLLSFSSADGQVQLAVFADISPPPQPTVVALRAIARGDVIRAADIELATIEVNSKSTGQRATFDSVEKLIGMEASQAIRVGEAILVGQVRSPIMVRRGDVITVISQGGGIRVRTSAKALSDGARGDLVQVESLGSREKFDVRIVGPREAAVFAISRPTTPELPTRMDTARR
jgi:flagella basal body P-ring formation protein FlgA